MEDFDGVQAAKPHTQDDADPRGVALVDDEAGVLDQHVAGGDGELNETVHAPSLLCGNAVGFGVEALDFAGNAGVESGGVKQGDGPDARFAGQKVVPTVGDIPAQRRQRGYAGYNNAFAAHSFLMRKKVYERLMIQSQDARQDTRMRTGNGEEAFARDKKRRAACNRGARKRNKTREA